MPRRRCCGSASARGSCRPTPRNSGARRRSASKIRLVAGRRGEDGMSGNSLPAGWPEARPLAVAVNVMLEGWTDDSAPGIGPMGNPLKPGVLDLQARSWAAYGPEAGAWRLLEILEGFGLKAVFYTSGIVAQRYSALLQAIAAAGH